jgi:serine phosphatase RsbU (regulator of sigma subunit)
VNKLEESRRVGANSFRPLQDWETLVNKPEERQTLRRRELRTPRLARTGDFVNVKSNPDLTSGAAPSSRALSEQLAALRRDHDGLRREFSEAAQVQRRLSPPCRLRRGLFDIAGEIFPVRHLSGDFLTAFDAGLHTVLGVGDIAGKGGSAGMWFTHLIGLVRIFARSLKDPAAVAVEINGHLAALQPEAPITSLFLTWADTRTGELVYCNAGHPAPLVFRRDGSVEWLNAGGAVLGAVPDATFVNGSTTLHPGDTLLSYSDGILECQNTQGEQFGLERLVDATRSTVGGRSAVAVLFSVLGATQDFAASEPRIDDLALMVVHHRGGR